MDVILLHRQLLALGQGVIPARCRSHGHVPRRDHGDIALGIDLAGDGADVTLGFQRQSLPRFDACGVVGEVPVQLAACVVVEIGHAAA